MDNQTILNNSQTTIFGVIQTGILSLFVEMNIVQVILCFLVSLMGAFLGEKKPANSLLDIFTIFVTIFFVAIISCLFVSCLPNNIPIALKIVLSGTLSTLGVKGTISLLNTFAIKLLFNQITHNKTEKNDET